MQIFPSTSLVFFILYTVPASIASHFSDFYKGNYLYDDLNKLPTPKNSHIAKCPPCDQVQCAVKSKAKLKCKGGLAADYCNCCPICAKVEGEHCGGEYNILGTCDRGLFCAREESLDELDRFAPQYGVCKKQIIVSSALDNSILADEGRQERSMKDMCRPKCTPEYCQKHPRSICSAVDNAEKRNCPGVCQHTSCLACRFDEPESCAACPKGDFDFGCIKRFGRCVRKKSRSFRKKYQSFNATAKFQCLVPECSY